MLTVITLTKLFKFVNLRVIKSYIQIGGVSWELTDLQPRKMILVLHLY